MKLNMTIEHEVTDTTPEVKKLLEEIVSDEARSFVAAVRRRLEEAGVEDISMSLNQS